ncbi:hypothetical protein GE061_002977 [Apolygus lucorum]|uniref:Uncharacterized protein n=1 Tax=Apolygus lucorum TaxID=248454 RepID=A0A8S9X274_APOLU|nr:hypothetical protein GE061_002977 [Apolygus lucorum]
MMQVTARRWVLAEIHWLVDNESAKPGKCCGSRNFRPIRGLDGHLRTQIPPRLYPRQAEALFNTFFVTQFRMAASTTTTIVLAFLIASSLFVGSDGGPIAAGICYAGCASIVVACFAAAGFTFGTVPGAQIAAVPALAGCNTAFGVCEAACVAALVTPVP